MINSYISNMYLASIVFAVGFCLLKKVAYYVYIEDYKGFAFAKEPYYWFEFSYIICWVHLTPVHTYNQALGVILVCMLAKLTLDRLTFIDITIKKFLKKKQHNE